jgi:hypothetical protein
MVVTQELVLEVLYHLKRYIDSPVDLGYITSELIGKLSTNDYFATPWRIVREETGIIMAGFVSKGIVIESYENDPEDRSVHSLYEVASPRDMVMKRMQLST